MDVKNYFSTLRKVKVRVKMMNRSKSLLIAGTRGEWWKRWPTGEACRAVGACHSGGPDCWKWERGPSAVRPSDSLEDVRHVCLYLKLPHFEVFSHKGLKILCRLNQMWNIAC